MITQRNIFLLSITHRHFLYLTHFVVDQQQIVDNSALNENDHLWTRNMWMGDLWTGDAWLGDL